MMRSLYAGVSGLNANQKSMDVIGNNIANVNTIGFKTGRAVFQDMLSQTLNTGRASVNARGGINPRQVGTGSYLVAVDNIFTQGTVKTTGRPHDLAIEGDGFFVVRAGDGAKDMYTRAGDFNFDSSGYLTTPSGYIVQGWMSDPTTGEIQYNSIPSDVMISDAHKVMQARETSLIEFGGVLDTKATASVITYKPLKTIASGKQNIFNLDTTEGAKHDLKASDSVRVRAHALGDQDINALYNEGGQSLALLEDKGYVMFKVDGKTVKFTYSEDTTGANKFNSLNDLMALIKNEVGALTDQPGAIKDVRLENGRVVIEANADTTFNIESIDTSSAFLDNIFSGLENIYAGDYKTSATIFHQQDLSAGVDFENLDEYAAQVENIIRGMGTGFKATFLENDFGMPNTGQITFDISDSIGGASTPIALTYVSNPAEVDIATGKFNNLSDMADAIETLGVAAGHDIDVSVVDGMLVVENLATATDPVVMSNFQCFGSPYIENLLASSFNGRLIGVGDAAQSQVIEGGKGTIAYFTESDPMYLNNEFGMIDGETFSIDIDTTSTVGGVTTTTTDTITLTYADTIGGTDEFNDMATFIAALNSEIAAAGITDLTAVNGGNGVEFRNTATPAAGDSYDVDFSGITSTTPNAYFQNLMASAFNGQTIIASTAITSQPLAPAGTVVNLLPSRSVTGLSMLKHTSGDTFNDNILIGNSDGTDGISVSAANFARSERWLTAATEDTLMYDLFTENGNPCNFNEGATSIEFGAIVGGERINGANTFSVADTSSLKDMMDALETFLGLGDDFNDTDNVTLVDGKITVTGEKGKANSIDELSITGQPLDDLIYFANDFGISSQTDATGGQLATNMSVFDEQGNEHIVQFTFSMHNFDQNEWSVTLTSADPDVTVNINGAATNEMIIKFNPDGSPAYIYDRFVTPNRVITNPTINLDPGNGANVVSDIALDLGTSGEKDGLFIANAAFDITERRQDGYTVGTLEDKLFDDAGNIVGVYTNGVIRNIGQVAVASFINNQGLAKAGDTMFTETSNSGEALIGTAMSGSRGKIASNSLEQANVDLSSEFVDMIVTERAFQANSRVITTSDEMIQELLTLKR